VRQKIAGKGSGQKHQPNNGAAQRDEKLLPSKSFEDQQ
jgi:hypothetical protein